jgi:predicted PurR-regulated permease PerM
VAVSRSRTPMDHPVVILFVIIAVVAAMGLAAEVLKPLALSILLAFALTPAAKFFERLGLPKIPAVVITVMVTLGCLAFLGYVVGNQLNDLAGNLSQPDRRRMIDEKLKFFRVNPTSNISRVQETLKEVANSMDPDQPKVSDATTPRVSTKDSKPSIDQLAGNRTLTGEKIPQVEIVQSPKFTEKLQNAIGPFLEVLTVGSFVLILTIFMMVGREDLGDRVVALFGGRQIGTTTRTMHEVGNRIGRYLATNAMVNAGFGVVIGTGMHIIGLPYAALWGVMAAVLRFIPYVGTVIAFSLPTTYAVASFPGWGHALAVIGLFLVVEMTLNSFLEPIIYGKTTGVSALGLLVAAMFWTWLWGVWGLILSTPITVALAVLGKYVPALRFFSTILSDDTELGPDVRYYQKLLSLDEDGATEIVDEALKDRPRIEVFDQILLPALARAERDLDRDEIDENEQAFIRRVTSEILDELAELHGPDANPIGPVAKPAREPIDVVGIPAYDKSDLLALRMLALVIDPAVCRLTIREERESPMQIADSLASNEPALILVSYVPPSGLTNVRYLVRRLHVRLTDLPIFVARWTDKGDVEKVTERLKAAGAQGVVVGLAEVRDTILAAATPKAAKAPPLSPALA